MAISTKNIKTQLEKVAVQLEQLQELVDERLQLVSVLQLTPSRSDNMDIITLLSKIKAGLVYVDEDLADGILKELSAEFSDLVKEYTSVVEPLRQDPYIEIEEYIYQVVHRVEEVGTKKSVRFEDFATADDADESTHLRNQLMGTAANFRPYKDTPDNDPASDSGFDFEGDSSADADRHTLLSVNTLNEEMFAQHQQQMLEQDQGLDALHKSIRTQHRMGVGINEELDEHLILLNDLEQGVDGSHTRVRRATNGIAKFRRSVKENGSLATIVVLTVVLILLLVVLN